MAGLPRANKKQERKPKMISPDKRLRPIMLGGTGSDVGKSVLAAGLCRVLRQDGFSPAPFKAQNMALNSFVTPDGLEIGRAQAMQAEAASVSPKVEMNPILLKPNTDQASQLVLMGVPVGNQSASEYFRREGREELRKIVHRAFDELSSSFSPIVLEGAGSVAEINLAAMDLVNMPMAEYADAAVLLVVDINRGGVFASAYGSIMLLPEHQRKLIKGIIVNKFRGDRMLFEDGRRMLEEICQVPVVGVLPYFKDIYIEEEDSLPLDKKRMETVEGLVNVAVVLLKRLSNFTDFDMLEKTPGVHLFYTADAELIEQADVILLPGSKSTIEDLKELRRTGVADAVLRAARRGAVVMGICGGYQMMGLEVADPLGIEGKPQRVRGLGLIPTRTEMQREKVTRQSKFTLCVDDSRGGSAYEIHQGETTLAEDAEPSPLCKLDNGCLDGYFRDSHCMGTYLHGILDNSDFIDFLLSPFADRIKVKHFDAQAFKEEQYDRLAALLREHIDMDYVYDLIYRRC